MAASVLAGLEVHAARGVDAGLWQARAGFEVDRLLSGTRAHVARAGAKAGRRRTHSRAHVLGDAAAEQREKAGVARAATGGRGARSERAGEGCARQRGNGGAGRFYVRARCFCRARARQSETEGLNRADESHGRKRYHAVLQLRGHAAHFR